MPVDVDPEIADLLADTVSSVVRRVVAPAAADADEDGRLPDPVVDALQASGLIDLPAEPPGLVVSACRGLAAGSAAAALLCASTAAAGGAGHAGAIPGLVSLDPVGAAGPGAGGIWALSGSTAPEWVPGSGVAVFVVVGVDGDGAERTFLVAPGAAGVTVGPPLRTSGLRAARRARVDLRAAPGVAIGDAVAVASARRVWLLGLGATAVGVGRAALEAAAGHLRSRSQFGSPLSRFPALRALVGDLADELFVADAAVIAAAVPADRDLERAAAAARVAAAAAVHVTGEAIQLHGGYGYIVDTGVERLFRDALSLRARILGAASRVGDGAVESLLGPA